MASTCRIIIKGRLPFSGPITHNITLKKNQEKYNQKSKLRTYLMNHPLTEFGSKQLQNIEKLSVQAMEETKTSFVIKGISKIAAKQKDQWCFIYAAYFQRLVARTPLDEDYHYIGADGYRRYHSSDDDVTRHDWVLYVNGTPIRATDFPDSYFYKFNDRVAIDTIAKKIKEVVGAGKMLHTVGVENKNWKFSILEEGKYPNEGRGNIAIPGEGQYPHGTINGFSVQAPKGIKAVTDAEMAKIAQKSKNFFRSYMAKTNLSKDTDDISLEQYKQWAESHSRKKIYTDYDIEALKRVIAFYEKNDWNKTNEILRDIDGVFGGDDFAADDLWRKVMNNRRSRKSRDSVSVMSERDKAVRSIFKKQGKLSEWTRLYHEKRKAERERELAAKRELKKNVKSGAVNINKNTASMSVTNYVSQSLTRRDVIRADVNKATAKLNAKKMRAGRKHFLNTNVDFWIKVATNPNSTPKMLKDANKHLKKLDARYKKSQNEKKKKGVKGKIGKAKSRRIYNSAEKTWSWIQKMTEKGW